MREPCNVCGEHGCLLSTRTGEPCQCCGEHEWSTLSTDSHPQGANLLVCRGCAE